MRKKGLPHTTFSGPRRPSLYTIWHNKDSRVKTFDIDTEYQPETEIVKGCCKKKATAQKQLYDRYCNVLYSTACRIMNDRAMAEDALHDSFIKIFRDIKHLHEANALLAWMKRITVNTSLQMLERHRRIEYTNNDSFIDRGQRYDPMDGEQLEKAIAILPDGYRIVFLLTEVEGYKHHEVAEMLGISAGTSKSQLHYARQRLIKILKRPDF